MQIELNFIQVNLHDQALF